MYRSLFLGFTGLAAVCLLPSVGHAQPGFSLEETRIDANITGPLAEVSALAAELPRHRWPQRWLDLEQLFQQLSRQIFEFLCRDFVDFNELIWDFHRFHRKERKTLQSPDIY